MCGIAAVFGPDHGDAVSRMLTAISHRGPDERGIHTTHNASLGIQRLSIVGLTDGSQPLLHPSSDISLVCNGEIYNHKTLLIGLGTTYRPGQSDAQAVMDMYEELGHRTFSQLDGMFAIIIHDGYQRTFVAARDRFGIKPLYYIKSADTWYFASEIKALTILGEDARLIRAVPPGHMVTRDGVQPYVIEPEYPLSSPRPAKLRALLEAAVEKQLQADPEVRFGIFLSGGLDSSILAALASKHKVDLTAFTIGAANSPDVTAARLVASHVGIRLVECDFDLADFRTKIAEAVRVMESYNVAIVFEGLLTMELARAAAREGVKVVLSGEGADELFAGYGFFHGLSREKMCLTRRCLLSNIGNTECKRLDLSTSAFGVEARVPFLDPGLVDYVMTLPPSCLIRQIGDHLVEKWILRETFGGVLPEAINRRAKLAFDHGSGILPLVDQASAIISDKDFIRYRRRFPHAGIVDKVTLLLHRHWRQRYGDAGGEDVYAMFGEYPLMQASLRQEVYVKGGTGKPDDVSEWLNGHSQIDSFGVGPGSCGI